jgi:hypothetical protein
MLEETFEKVAGILATELLWFAYPQNNSGGHFVQTDDVCEWVLVQALDEAAANVRAHELLDESGKDWCPCCGERWDFALERGTREPEIHGDPVRRVLKFAYREKCILHYADGRREVVVFE